MSSSRIYSYDESYYDLPPLEVKFDNIDRLDVMYHSVYGTWLVKEIIIVTGDAYLAVVRLDGGDQAGNVGRINESTLCDWKRLHNVIDLYANMPLRSKL